MGMRLDHVRSGRKTPQQILHFTLPGLLPPETQLALNMELGCLSLLDYSQIQAQETFTRSEMSVLLPPVLPL